MSYNFEYVFRQRIEGMFLLFAHFLKGKHESIDYEKIKNSIKTVRYEPYEEGELCLSLNVESLKIEIEVYNFYSACDGDTPLYMLHLTSDELFNESPDNPYFIYTSENGKELHFDFIKDGNIFDMCKYLKK
jgi:hypothetical protein